MPLIIFLYKMFRYYLSRLTNSKFEAELIVTKTFHLLRWLLLRNQSTIVSTKISSTTVEWKTKKKTSNVTLTIFRFVHMNTIIAFIADACYVAFSLRHSSFQNGPFDRYRRFLLCKNGYHAFVFHARWYRRITIFSLAISGASCWAPFMTGYLRFICVRRHRRLLQRW